jgi:hypothetical protein
MKLRQATAQDRKIQSFWRWFSEHSAELAAGSVSQPLVSELERRLFAIHRLDWEIGPGQTSPNLFALSPRGDLKLLRVTRSVIAQAPSLIGWEFHPAKPPRAWKLAFSIMVNDKAIEIDGKLWEFLLFEFKDATYDLVLKPNRGRTLPEECLHWAATIIADGELGEETRMDRISNIEVVKTWDEVMARSARKLEPGLLARVLKQPASGKQSDESSK